MYGVCGWAESEDEDLHQCGRCRAMFCRLSDFAAHKQRKSCHRRFLDCEVQTPPVPDPAVVVHADDGCRQTLQDNLENIDLSDAIKSSLQTTLGVDDDVEDANPLNDGTCSYSPMFALPTISVEPEPEHETVLLHDLALVPLHDITSEDLSHGSSVDVGTGEVAASSSPDEKLQVLEEPSINDPPTAVDVVAAVGLPGAPPPHQCPQCNFMSKFREDFDQHLRQQHGLSTHICADCLRAFADDYKLHRHQRLYCTKTPIRKKHNALLSAGQPTRHVIAPKFMTLERRKRTAEDDSTPFRCHICSDEFAGYEAVLSHVTAVHSAVAKPGICRFCGAWFANPYKLRRHVSSSIHDDVPTDVMASFKQQIDRMSISCTAEAVRLLRRARAEHRQQRLTAAGTGTECLLCQRTFSARSALVRHCRVVHGRRTLAAELAAPTISCQLCGASFDRRRAYLRHRRDEHGKLPAVRARPPATRKCHVCERSFKRPDAAARHQSSVHTAHQQLPDDFVTSPPDIGRDAASSTCFVCARPAESRAECTRHLQLCHRVWVPLADGPVPAGLFDDMPAIPPCLRGHVDESLAASHVKYFGPHSPPVQSPEQIVPSGPARRQSKSSLPCPYCRHTFSSLQALYEHKVDYHRLDPVFRCVVSACRLVCATLADYESHAAVSGHSQAAFICAVCNEHFDGLVGLLSHRGSVHRQDRLRRQKPTGPLAGCDTAPPWSTGAAQTTKSAILCDQCGQTFSRRATLARHRAVVHKHDTSRRRYGCAQCDRKFFKREHLKRHVTSRHATARPYVCRAAECGRAFKRKDKLQEHYRCHSTAKQYSCPVCGRSYRGRDGLRAHERTHHGPEADGADEARRTHRCRRCTATFRGSGKLAEHLRTVHGRGAGKDVYAHRCETCDKTFPRPERVRRHAEKEHNVVADWSHRCTVCNKGFAGQRSYELHMAKHHADPSANMANAGSNTGRRGRRPTKPAAATSQRTGTTEPVPRNVVVTGRHHHAAGAASSTELYRVSSRLGMTPRAQRLDADQTPSAHSFNRFFVPSSSQRASTGLQQCDEAESRASRIYCPTATSHQVSEPRLDDVPTNELRTSRRLSLNTLPYLHHPANNTGGTDYSYYPPSYPHHAPPPPPPPPHRTQFSFYPSTPAGFGYGSHSACAATQRACGLFPPTDRAAALPFGVQSADTVLTGQMVDRRPSEFGCGLASVMTGDYGSGSSSGAPIRPLATQPTGAGCPSAYCPVPDPPSVGRWFDNVPALLPPPVDAASLDAVRWPPRPRPGIDTLAVRSHYALGMTPACTTGYYSHQPTGRSVDTLMTTAAAGNWPTAIDARSCLLSCSGRTAGGVDCAGGGPAGSLMLAASRRVDMVDDGRVDSLYGGTMTYPRDTAGTSGGPGMPRGTTVPHGMLSLLPPW